MFLFYLLNKTNISFFFFLSFINIKLNPLRNQTGAGGSKEKKFRFSSFVSSNDLYTLMNKTINLKVFKSGVQCHVEIPKTQRLPLRFILIYCPSKEFSRTETLKR